MKHQVRLSLVGRLTCRRCRFADTLSILPSWCGLVSLPLHTYLITDKEDPIYKPTHISILDQPVASPVNNKNDQDPRNKKNTHHGRKNRPISQELGKPQGTIDHKK